MRTEDFVAFVRARHPEQDLRVFDDGWDHVVVAAGNSGYRFVRDDPGDDDSPGGPADREASPEAERALLSRLAPGCPVRVPQLDQHDDNGFRYSTFDFITGIPLHPSLFAALEGHVQARIARQVGAFLSHLHAISADEGRRFGLSEDDDEWGAWVEEAVRDAESLLPDGTTARIRGLFARHESIDRGGRTVIHGDFSHYHLILDPNGEELAGVIDFADAVVGDPAMDFGLEGPYGREFLEHAYRAYAPERAEAFDERRLLLEMRTAVFDLHEALGMNPFHQPGRRNEDEIARVAGALTRLVRDNGL